MADAGQAKVGGGACLSEAFSTQPITLRSLKALRVEERLSLIYARV